MRNTKRKVKQIGYSLLVSLYLIMIALAFIAASFIYEKNENPEHPLTVVMYSGPPTYTELRPNNSQIFDGEMVRIKETNLTINSFGMRDHEYPVAKPNGTFRIAAIGDSVTFGWGVALEESYVKRMEKYLNTKKESQIEVLNFGVPGYEAINEVGQYNKSVASFSPDLVIIQFWPNDDTDGAALQTQLNEILSDKSFMKKNNISTTNEAYAYVSNIERARKSAIGFEANWEANVQAPYSGLADTLKEKNTSLVIFIAYADAEQEAALREFAKSRENVFILKSKVNILNRIFQLNKFDQHPNNLAHWIYSREIGHFLIKKNIVPN